MKKTFIVFAFICCTSFNSIEKVYWKAQAVMSARGEEWNIARIIEAPNLEKANNVFTDFILTDTLLRQGYLKRGNGQNGKCFWILPFNPKKDILK